MRCEYCLRGERSSDGICPLCRFDGVPRNQAPFLPEGTAVGGRYVLGRQEGHGGFSICYRAWDNVNDEMVAIKELFPWEVAERLDSGTVGINPQHRSDFDTAVNCLRHEGEVLRKLTKEPGIVRVGDAFQDNDTAYLPMEYLRGQSYEKYLQNQYAKNQAHLDVEAAVNVALTVLGALDAVHARELLHLDVKPANIRVLDDGRIVLFDFGSTRDAFRQGNGPYGDTFTPGFAAPEQHYASGTVTAATDVHGLAATLYYSLSLRVPTRADEREEGAVLTALSELNPAVSEALDVVIQKAMALAPEDRYPSVNSFRMALEPFGTMRRQPPPRLSAPSPLRIVAGLLGFWNSRTPLPVYAPDPLAVVGDVVDRSGRPVPWRWERSLSRDFLGQYGWVLAGAAVVIAALAHTISFPQKEQADRAGRPVQKAAPVELPQAQLPNTKHQPGPASPRSPLPATTQSPPERPTVDPFNGLGR